MQIEKVTIDVQTIDVDVDSLMRRYNVSGFSINAANALTEDGIGAEIVVNYDDDEPDEPRFLTLYKDEERPSCAIEDCGGADLTDDEEAFFVHLAEIVTGVREA